MLETDLSIIDCGDNTFKIQLNNAEILNVDVQYSFDNSTWFDYSYQSPIGVGETTTVYARAKDINDDTYITKNKTIKYYRARPVPPNISYYGIKFFHHSIGISHQYYYYTIYAICGYGDDDSDLVLTGEYYSDTEAKWIPFDAISTNENNITGINYCNSTTGYTEDSVNAYFNSLNISEVRVRTEGSLDKYKYKYSAYSYFNYDTLVSDSDLVCDFNSNTNFLKCDDNNLRFYIGSPSTHDTCSAGLCGDKIYYKIEYAATDSLVGNYSYNYLPNEIGLDRDFTLEPYNNTNVYYTTTLKGTYGALDPGLGYYYYIQLDDEIYGPYKGYTSIKDGNGLGNPYLKYKDEEDNGLPFFLYNDGTSVDTELYSLNNNSTLKIHKVNTEFLIGAKSIDYDNTLDYSYFVNYLKKLNKKYIIFYLSASCPCGYYYNKGNHIVITTDKDYAHAKKANGKYHPCAPYVVKDGNWTQCALNSAVLSKLKDDTGEYILDSNGENIYTLEDSSVISNS